MNGWMPGGPTAHRRQLRNRPTKMMTMVMTMVMTMDISLKTLFAEQFIRGAHHRGGGRAVMTRETPTQGRKPPDAPWN